MKLTIKELRQLSLYVTGGIAEASATLNTDKLNFLLELRNKLRSELVNSNTKAFYINEIPKPHKFTAREALDYEINCSWMSNCTGPSWLQDLIGWYLVKKSNRKYKRYAKVQKINREDQLR